MKIKTTINDINELKKTIMIEANRRRVIYDSRIEKWQGSAQDPDLFQGDTWHACYFNTGWASDGWEVLCLLSMALNY